jgi:hypothetical protein
MELIRIPDRTRELFDRTTLDLDHEWLRDGADQRAIDLCH